MNDETRDVLPAMMDARGRFMDLVAEIRPELHRYCARMTGSVIDGEDVVQETFAKAYYALGQMFEPPNLRPWLFRIAHNAAMDFVKRYERNHVEPVADLPERAQEVEREVDPSMVETALAVFVELPPMQRSALILKDVLGQSLDEAAATMGTTVGAVKAALSRARANILRARKSAFAQRGAARSPDEQALLERYAALFNERDWDGLRAMLADEARLDLVSRYQQTIADAGYFDRYREILEREDLRAHYAIVDGVDALAVFRAPALDKAAYFILLETRDGRVSRVRDFRYVPYIGLDANVR